MKKNALPFFIDWLIDNVIFVEIKTFSDDDAYLIFETMNDRGLNLSPTEMLKGYLLSNINREKVTEIEELWRKKISVLDINSKDEDLEFFRAWLRSKFAETIRTSKEGAENEDFELISTRFHSWVKDNTEKIGLKSQQDYLRFIKDEFIFFSDLYLLIGTASLSLEKDLDSIYYINSLKFAKSLYAPLLMAPIKLDDNSYTIKKKLAVVGKFLETFVVFRRLNNRTTAHASIRRTMYALTRDIRSMELEELTKFLKEKVKSFEENLSGMDNFGLNQQNRNFVQFMLARITSYIEQRCGMPSRFTDYLDRHADKPFEVEHIWANKYELHKVEFEKEKDFVDYRNRLGGLILVPSGFNQSYGDGPYESKVDHYFGQNLLAKTLSSKCYQKNPSLRKFMQETELPFKPYARFTKNSIEERQMLYQKICEKIWNIDEFE